MRRRVHPRTRAGVSEANGVLRNHYHPPGEIILFIIYEKRLTGKSASFIF